MQFSANLGFLWTDLSLPDAIRAAKAAGFDAVECHWPYDTPADEVKAALAETGLPMLGLNTRRGDVPAGDMGLSAVPGREVEARAAIDEALAYADAVGAGAVHVMAGNAVGPDAHACFVDALRYAVDAAAPLGIVILIEPLNAYDAPSYFLRTSQQANDIIEAVGSDRLKLMFDCYHVARTEGDVLQRFAALQSVIGHVQFAGVPLRGAPDQGDLDYAEVFKALDQLGWPHPLGAEYKPDARTEDSLGWMSSLT